jgi:proline iminopeptidase
MDLRKDLKKITCPTLLLAGEQDPITPTELSEEIAHSLGSKVVRLERLPGCGHPVFKDDPDRSIAVIRDFVQSLAAIPSSGTP